jgi:hypothetical protein
MIIGPGITFTGGIYVDSNVSAAPPPSDTFGGSGSFNVTTTNQTFQIPTNSAFTYGTGDFTVEWFSNQTGTSGVQGIWRNSTGDATNSIGFWTITQSGGRLTVTLGNGVSSNTIQSNAAITTQTWHHYALVRNDTLFKLYVDGVGQTQTITSSISIPAQVGFMQIGNAGGLYSGFITNFRIVKGTAVYTSDFTPPTSPLTVISGTSLLLKFSSAALLTKDDSPFNHTITNTGPTTYSVGTPSVTAGVVASGLSLHFDAGNAVSYPGSGTTWTSLVNGYTGSMGTGVGYSASNGGVITFNGASTAFVNMYTSASVLVGAATNNFSIEAWYQSNNNFPGIMRTGSGSRGFVFGYFGTTGTAWKVTKYNVIDLQAGTIPQNTSWHQAVLTYSSTTGVRVYIDGALSGTAVNNNSNLIGGLEFSVGRGENVTLNGSMGIFRWYSAVLSASDVLQNFNAQRARFGI